MTSLMFLTEPGTLRSYQAACDKMYEVCGTDFGWDSNPFASGMHRARERLTAAACQDVWQAAKDWSESQLAPVTEIVPGRRLIAFDGTTLIMPRSASCSAAYGIRRDRNGEEISHYPEALLCSAWDVERRLPITWETISTLAKGGERRSLLALLDKTPESSILVIDRGLPSRGVCGAIIDSGRDVVMRMSASPVVAWTEITDFLKTGAKTGRLIIETVMPDGKSKSVPMRIVVKSYSRGRPQKGQKRDGMVILTTLVDDSISDETIIEIYKKRWGIETIYNELKTHVGIETWHSKTKNGIDQEILARMMWHLLVGHIASHVEAESQIMNQGTRRRVNSKRVLEYAADAASYIMEARGKPKIVKEYLLAKAARHLGYASRLYTCRKRSSKSRKPLHPYARTRNST